MRYRRFSWLAPALLLAVAAPAEAAPAIPTSPPAPATGPEARRLRFQFKDAPFEQVLETVSRLSGKPVIGQTRIEGKLTFFSAEVYPLEEAIDLLRQILLTRGFTLVERPQFIEVLKADQAAAAVSPVAPGKLADRPGSEIVTVILPVRYLAVEELEKELKGFLSPFGRLGALKRNNRLVVTDTVSHIERIKALLEQLEGEGPAQAEFRVFALQHAPAQQTASVIQAVFKSGATPAAPAASPEAKAKGPAGTDSEGRLSIGVDMRTNRLLVRAAAADLAFVEQMVRLLDVPAGTAPGAANQVRILQVRNARAEELARRLTATVQALHKASGKPSAFAAVPDARTNRLVVSADADELALVDRILQELDTAVEQPMRQVCPFKLQHARADEVAKVLAEMFREPLPPPTGSAAPQQPNPPPPPGGLTRQLVQVVADARTNTVFVVGSGDEVTQAGQLVKLLDSAVPEHPIQIRTYPLQTKNVKSVAEALTRLMGAAGPAGRGLKAGQIHFEADPATGLLLVRAPESEFASIESLIQKLDAVRPEEVKETCFFKLTFARAEQVASTLRSLFGKESGRRSYFWWWDWAPPSRDDDGTFRAAADPRSNQVIVTATKDVMVAVRNLIGQLDTEAVAQASQVRTRVRKLQGLRAANLVETLREMPFRRDAQGRVQPIPMSANAQLNAIVLACTDEEYRAVDQVITEMDFVPEGSAIEDAHEVVEERLLRLQHVAPEEVLRLVGTLLSDRGLRAAPVEHINAVVAFGPRSKLHVLEKLVQQFDVEKTAAVTELRTVQLASARAADVAEAIQNLFPADQYKIPPRVAVVPGANALLIRAPQTQAEEIDRLIERLDKAVPVDQRRTVLIPLARAQAQDLARTLRTLYASSLSAEAPADQRVDIAFESKSNTLVVTAPRQQVAQIQELVTQLQTGPSTQPQRVLRIVPLKSTRAPELVRVLTGMVGSPRRAQTGATGISPDEITITPDPHSNAVVLAGTAAAVDKVQALIGQLDTVDPDQQVEIRVLPLKTAHAGEVARRLNELFGRRGSGEPAGGRWRCTADARLNAVIVHATAGDFRLVQEVVRQLDAAAPREPGAQREIRVVKLTRADADDLAYTIRSLLKIPAYASRDEDRPAIEADPLANRLLISARPEEMEQILAVVRQYEPEAAGAEAVAGRVRIIRPRGVRAVHLADVLRKLYAETGGQGRLVVKTTSEARTDAAATQAGTRREANAGPVPGPTATMPRRVQAAPGGRPGAAPAGTTTQPADKAGAAAKKAPPKAPEVQIVVDEASNSLLLKGDDAEIEKLQEIINQLTATAGPDEGEVRIYRLEHGDASAVSRTLDNLLNIKETIRERRRDGTVQERTSSTNRVRIAVDSRTNSLIIRATALDFYSVEALLKQLDAVEADLTPIQTRLYRLEKATAREVVETLREVFRLEEPAGRRPAREGAEDRQVAAYRNQIIRMMKAKGLPEEELSRLAAGKMTLAANPAINAVVVSAPPAHMDLVASLIEEMDQAVGPREIVANTVKLRHADAAAVARSLQAVYQGRDQVAVTGDSRTQTLLVRAAQKDWTDLKAMIEAFDAAPTTQPVERRVFSLKLADATTTARILPQILRSGAAGPPDPRDRVVAEAERATNSLVVTASPENMRKIEELLKRLDVEEAAQLVTRTLELRHADAAAVAGQIRAVYQQILEQRRRTNRPVVPFSIQGNAGQHTLLVSGSPDDLTVVEQMVRQLDVAGPKDPRTTKVIALENADAFGVQQALAQMFPRRRDGAPVPLVDQVDVSSERAGNTLVVCASAANHEKIAALVADMDRAGPARFQARTFKVVNADLEDVYDALNTLYAQVEGQMGRGPRAARTPLAIVPEYQTNSLIVTGTEEHFAIVADLLEKLDVKGTAPSRVKREMKVIKLERADASSVASTIQQLYAQRLREGQERRRGRPGRAPIGRREEQPPFVSAARSTNAVIVWGTEEQIESIERIIGQIDAAPLVRDVNLEFIVLTYADAEDVAAKLNAFYQAQQRGGRGRWRPAGVEEPPVLILGDARTQTVMVSAPKAEFEQIKSLCEQLDRPIEGGELVREVFALVHADAGQVAQMIQQQFSQAGTAWRGGRRRGPAPGAGEEVRVSAERTTNAVVVSATKKLMTEIAEIIDEIDKGEGTKFEVRSYKLAHAKAEEIFGTLVDLYRQQATGRARGGPGARADQPLAVTADPRQNAIIASGAGKDFQVIEELILRLDVETPAGEQQVTKIYALEEGDAASVARSLQQILAPRRPGAGRRGPDGAVDGGPLIAAEPSSNSLVVRATAREHEEIARFIQELSPPKDRQLQREVVSLQHVDASQAAQAITLSFRPTGRGRAQDPREQVTAFAPRGARSVVVTASAENMAKVKQLIAAIDRVETAGRFQVKTFTLKHADATEALWNIRQLYEQVTAGRADRRERLALTDDYRTNSILASGWLEEDFKLIEELVQKFDVAPEKLEGGQIVERKTRIYKLVHVDADATSIALTQAFGAKWGEHKSEAKRVSVSPERSSNTVIVTATAELHEEVKKLIDEIDQPAQKARFDYRTIKLQNAQAADVALSLQPLVRALDQVRQQAQRRGPRAGGGALPPALPLAISADTRTNSIVVTGDTGDISEVEKLVARLDVTTPDDQQMKTIGLTHADAQEVATALRAMWPARAGAGAAPDVTVAALRTVNALVVKARAPEMKRIEERVQELDVPAAGQAVATRSYKLQHASAEQAFRTVGQSAMRLSAARRPPGRPGAGGTALNVTFDAATNQLLATGTEEDLKLLAEMVKQVDLPPDQLAERKSEVYLLRYAEAAGVARLIESTFAPRDARHPRPERDQVQAAAEPTANALIVVASAENHAEVQRLLRQVDVEGEDQYRTRPVALRHVRAEKIIDVLNLMLQPINSQMAARRGRRPMPITAAAEGRTNSILLGGAESHLAIAEQMVRTLDVEAEAAEVMHVRTFALENATAGDLARTLNEILAGQPTAASRLGRGRAQQAQELYRKFVVEHGAARAPATAPTTQPGKAVEIVAQIAADDRANLLVVSANLESMGLIEQMIALLDQKPVSQAVRIVTLKHISANDILNALQQTIRSWPRNPFEPMPTVSATLNGEQVVISASPGKVETLVRVIADMDTAEAGPGAIHRIPVVNGDAAELARTLQNFFPRRGDVIISADPVSNTLLVRASEPKRKEIDATVTALEQAVGDKTLPQKVYALRVADASEVARSIQQAFDPRSSGKAQAPPQERVIVSPMRTSNSLLVMASHENQTKIAALVKELDASPAGRLQRRVYALNKGRADRLAPLLGQVFGPSRSRFGGPDTSFQVAAEPVSNTLIVSTEAGDWAEFDALVKQFDVSVDDKIKSQTFVLKHIDASEAARVVQELLFQGRSAPRGAGGAEPRASGTRSSNILVVLGLEEDLARARRFIEEIDVPADEPTTQTVALKQAEAAALADILNQVLRNRPIGRQTMPVSVVANSATNTLVIRGPKSEVAAAKALAEQFDAEAAQAGAVEIRLVMLKHVQAADILPTVQQMLGAGAGAGRRPAEAAAPRLVKKPVTVSAVARVNGLSVMAARDDMPVVENLIASLDRLPEAKPVQVQTFQLASARAEELAGQLSDLLGLGTAGRPGLPTRRVRNLEEFLREIRFEGQLARIEPELIAVSANPRTNTLLVTAPAEVFPLIEAIVGSQEKAAAKVSVAQVLALERADAADVARTLQMVYRDLLAQRTGAALAIGYDQRANALVISAPPQVFAEIQDLVNKLEVTARPYQLHLIRVQHAAPEDVRAIIEQIRTLQRGGRFGPAGAKTEPAAGRTVSSDIRIVSPRGSDALLVSCSPEDMKALEALIQDLEAEAQKAKGKLKFFVLKYANAGKVAPMLNQVVRDLLRPRGPATERDRVSITADLEANAILVVASDENMKRIEELIRQIDQKDVTQPLEFKVFEIKHSRAERVAPLLQRLLTQMRQRLGRQDRAALLEIVPEPMSNTLLVMTARENFAEIEKLLGVLDQMPPSATADILLIPLRHARAGRLVQIIEQMIAGGAGPRGAGRGSELAEVIRRVRLRQPGAEAIPELNLDEPVKLIADEDSNSVFVSSSAANLKSLEAVIALLDKIPAGDAVTVRLFTLRYADVERVRRTLEDLYRQAADLSRAGPRERGGAPRLPETPAGRALVETVRFAADARLQVLIAAGTEEGLALVEVLLKEMDKEPLVEFAEMKLFRLEYADARELAATLEGVLMGPSAQRGAAAAGRYGNLAEYVIRYRLETAGHKALESRPPESRVPAVIRAEPTSNTLIVSASKEDLALVEHLVKLFDVDTAGGIRIFALKHAQAAEVQGHIASLFQNRRGLRPEDQATVTVDGRTNCLLVSTSARSFKLIEDLVQKLDHAQRSPIHELRTITLQNNEAARVARTLQQIVQERERHQQRVSRGAVPEQVIILADERTNSILVSASDATFGELEALVKQLEATPPAKEFDFRLVTMDKQDAARMARLLADLFNRRRQAGVGRDTRPPVILADDRSNSLVCSASPEDFQTIEDMVQRMEAIPFKPAMKIYVETLQHNDAAALGQQLMQLINTAARARQGGAAPEDQVTITTDTISNTLLIAANEDNYTRIKELLQKLDQEPVTGGIVRLITLKQADVVELERKLNELFRSGLYVPGQAAGARAGQRDKVTIVADQRTNTLIVSASPTNVKIIEDLVQQMEAAPTELVNVRFFRIKQTEAAQLQPTLQRILDAQPQVQGQPRASVTAEPRLNALVVSAPRDKFEMIEKLIGELDIERQVTRQFKTYELKLAAADTVAQTLQQIMASRPAAGGAPREPVVVIPDLRGRQLLCVATPEDHTEIAAILEKLDVDPSRQAVPRLFPLKRADANDVAALLRQLYPTGRGAGPGLQMTISVERRSNSVVVAAAEGDMKAIEELIEKLDQAESSRVSEMRIVNLKRSECESVNAIITSSLRSGARTQASGQEVIRLVAHREGGEKGRPVQEIASSIRDEFSLVSVPRSNSLIVKASPDAMGVILKLIEELDQDSPKLAQIRIYPLRNADARDTAKLLETLFRVKEREQAARTAQDYARRDTQLLVANAGAPAPAPSGAVGGENGSPLVPLSFTVDERTNSLLVSGAEADLAIVEELVSHLDAEEGKARTSLVVAVKNVKAADIVKAIDDFNKKIQGQLTQGTSELKQLEQEVYVVAEPNSNRILLNASQRYLDEVKVMIEELDQPPAQVLIQVLLAEITLDNSTEWGVEAMIKDLDRATDGTKTAGTDFLLKPTAGSPAQVRGFAVNVDVKDFMAYIQALQRDGKLQVLSRPQILASDNQEAMISVGEEVPRIVDTRTTDTGSIQNTISYEKIGITLQVRPQVNPDGFVKLEVNPEIVDITDSTVQISEGLSAPIYTQRRAGTTVTVKDGQTVVIGGLIGTTNDRQQAKVPILGDIPLLGLLFRSDSVRKRRTELLVIMTPHVLRTPEALQEASQRERRRAGAAEEEIRRTKLLDEPKPPAPPPPAKKVIDPALRKPEAEKKSDKSVDAGRPAEPRTGASATPEFRHDIETPDRR